MKVIADTCVWSLALRRKIGIKLPADQAHALSALTRAIQDGLVLMMGPIRQEILSGIRDKAQFARTVSLLEPFPGEPLTSDDYIHAARLYNLCRDHGVECGAIDMQLCTAAQRLKCSILTVDKALLRCIQVLQHARHLHRF